MEAVRQMGLQNRLSDETITRLLVSMDALEFEQMQEGASVRTADLLNLVSRNADRVLRSVTDQDLRMAGLRDKAVASGIFLEKRQLLMGEPTQILRVEERQQLNVLVAAVVKEAERRGLSFDSAPTVPHVYVDSLEDDHQIDNSEFGLRHRKTREAIEAETR